MIIVFLSYFSLRAAISLNKMMYSLCILGKKRRFVGTKQRTFILNVIVVYLHRLCPLSCIYNATGFPIFLFSLFSFFFFFLFHAVVPCIVFFIYSVFIATCFHSCDYKRQWTTQNVEKKKKDKNKITQICNFSDLLAINTSILYSYECLSKCNGFRICLSISNLSRIQFGKIIFFSVLYLTCIDKIFRCILIFYKNVEKKKKKFILVPANLFITLNTVQFVSLRHIIIIITKSHVFYYLI